VCIFILEVTFVHLPAVNKGFIYFLLWLQNYFVIPTADIYVEKSSEGQGVQK
jgi:hypothetical protein